MKKMLSLLLLVLLPLSALSEGAFDCPIDSSFRGYAPNPDGYTENGYSDESLTVTTEKREVDGVRYDLIWFTVKSPTQLRTAVAGKPNEPVTERPSRMARYFNAVAAINGEYYVQRTRDIIVYRQGVMFRNEPDPKKDVLIIDDKGDFHVFTSEDKKAEIEQFISDGGVIVNAFNFGPALVVDGQALSIREDYYFNCGDRLPRSVIAQVGPLSYLFIEAEGRSRESKGNTHQQMADYMATLGVKTAYNLDGGQSSVLLFGGKIFDDKTENTERPQSDIIYVVSAVNPEKK